MSSSCGGFGAGELILQLDVSQFGFYTVSTAGSSFDTVIYVLDGACNGTPLGCMAATPGTGGTSLMLGLAHAGTFFVVVDGEEGMCGNVMLTVQG
jgi:hypothetical protein